MWAKWELLFLFPEFLPAFVTYTAGGEDSKGASPNYFFQNNVIVTLSWNPPHNVTSFYLLCRKWNMKFTCMMHVHRKKKVFSCAKQHRLYRHFVGRQNVTWLIPSLPKHQNDVILEKIVWRCPLTRRLVIRFVTEFEFTQFAQWPYRLTCSVQKRPNPARVEQWGWSRVPSAL